jgi:hypothetical protein
MKLSELSEGIKYKWKDENNDEQLNSFIEDILPEIEKQENFMNEMLKNKIDQCKRIEKIVTFPVKSELEGLLADIFIENKEIIEKTTGKIWEKIKNEIK